MRYLRSRPLDRPTLRMPALKQHALEEACRRTIPEEPPTRRQLLDETEGLIEECR